MPPSRADMWAWKYEHGLLGQRKQASPDLHATFLAGHYARKPLPPLPEAHPFVSSASETGLGGVEVGVSGATNESVSVSNIEEGYSPLNNMDPEVKTCSVAARPFSRSDSLILPESPESFPTQAQNALQSSELAITNPYNEDGASDSSFWESESKSAATELTITNRQNRGKFASPARGVDHQALCHCDLCNSNALPHIDPYNVWPAFGAQNLYMSQIQLVQGRYVLAGAPVPELEQDMLLTPNRVDTLPIAELHKHLQFDGKKYRMEIEDYWKASSDHPEWEESVDQIDHDYQAPTTLSRATSLVQRSYASLTRRCGNAMVATGLRSWPGSLARPRSWKREIVNWCDPSV